MGKRDLSMHTLFLLLALLLAHPSAAAEPDALHLGSEGHYSLAPYLTYVEDASARLTADDLLRPSAGILFRRPGGREVNFGYSHSVFWLKAVLRGDNRTAEKFFLELAYPTLDRATVFLTAADGSRQIAEAGDLQPFAARPYRHHNLVFPLLLPAGEEVTLLIRVQSEGSLTVPATLWRESAFYRESLNEYAILSLYFGILGALFLYNFLLYLSLREQVYLAYIGFVASMAVGQLSQCGFGNEFLWPAFPAWGNIAYPIGFAATGFFGALFTRLFLDTRRSTPKLDRMIVFLAAGFAFAALSPVFIPYQATAILTSLLGVTFSAVAVAAGVFCLLKGHPGARYFLLAWTLLLFGVGMLGMRNLAWLPTTFVTSYGMQMGSALEMLLLSFALADRINHMRLEKDAAQQTALLISNEKEKELAIKAREWEHTFNSISDMVVILDRDCRIMKANKAAIAFLGADTELLGRNCYELHHQDGLRPEACSCRDTFDVGKSATSEFYEPRFGRFVEVSTSPIFNAEGRVASAVHITKDITWRKKMEEELIRTRKLDSLAVLAGGIAHDFNNMLTIILSTTALAKMYAKDDAKVISKIEEAEREILRTRDLTNQILTFAKGGAPVKRLSSFPELLRDTVEFCLKGSNVGCELSLTEGLWAAEIDRVQISQVVCNIVINGVQAMPAGGTITVSALNTVIDERTDLPLKPGKYVRIDLKDRGLGIANEHLPSVFDPFFTTKAGGSGLGLATSYSIVKKHSGYIDVKTRPGEGTVFTVYLPASAEVHAPEPAQPAPELRGGGRVLLMDDDEALRANVAEMLETRGYDVETARNGEEAIILYKRALAHSRPFEAVVLDVTIVGGMGGKDCIGHLLKIDPGLPGIVISGYSEDAVLAEFSRYGFKDALPKPFTIEELQERLQGVMAGRRGGDA
jgi:PAS domain S-box-containing protein